MTQLIQRGATDPVAGWIDGTEAPTGVANGIPYDGVALAIDTSSAIGHYHMGLPFTSNGRLAASTEVAVARVGNGAAPFTADNRLAFSESAVLTGPASYIAGVGFTAESMISRVSSTPTPTPILGPELVVNGTFATNSDWQLGSGWSISGDKARCDGTQAGTTFLSQTTPAVIGSLVEVTFVLVDYVEGVAVGSLGTEAGTARARNSTFTKQLILEGNSDVSVYGNQFFIGNIALISVKEVL